MEHIFYSDGNTKNITWCIQTGDSVVRQSRVHVSEFRGKVTETQSKIIAMHVGLFWGIGTFKIKNKDNIIFRTDDVTIYEKFTSNPKTNDDLVEKRAKFVSMLIQQREIHTEFEMINPNENPVRIQERNQIED